jgi:hypothetical protein
MVDRRAYRLGVEYIDLVSCRIGMVEGFGVVVRQLVVTFAEGGLFRIVVAISRNSRTSLSHLFSKEQGKQKGGRHYRLPPI